MSSGIYERDTMFSVRERPWHGQGAILETAPTSVQEALEQSGLDWNVVPVPLYKEAVATDGLPGWPQKIDEFVANVREDTGDVVGIVSPRYQIIQNREAFQFLDDVLGSDVEWETAGSLRNNRRIWALCKVPGFVEIGGDPCDQFMFVQSRHDGFGATMVAPTVVRIVCQNTLTMAVQGAKRTYSVRHVGDTSLRIHEARKALDVVVKYGEKFKVLGDKLALEPISQDALLSKVLNELYPDGTTDRTKRNAAEVKERIIGLTYGGDTAGNSPGTKWAAVNAIVEARDWFRPVQGDTSRFGRALDDSEKNKALGLVLAA